MEPRDLLQGLVAMLGANRYQLSNCCLPGEPGRKQDCGSAEPAFSHCVFLLLEIARNFLLLLSQCYISDLNHILIGFLELMLPYTQLVLLGLPSAVWPCLESN